MKKNLLSFSVLLLVCLASFGFMVSAQENSPVSGAPSVNKPPLDVSILSLTVATTTGELVLNYEVINNRQVFADGLEYRLEMYRGDALAKDGNLFGSLEYAFNTTGVVNKIAPAEKIVGLVKFIPATSLKSGNYFARFVVFDREYKNIGLDYTKSPIALNGSGSFLGQIEAFFRTSKGDDFLMAGQLIDKAETPAIVIPLEKNPTLKQAINSGTKYSAEVRVLSLESDKSVHEYLPKQVLISTDKGGEKIVKITLEPWSGIKSFPYQVEVVIRDDKGNVAANKIIARWWVQGFMARIGDVQTETNFYNKNQKLDLSVNLIAFQWKDGQKATVDVSFEKPNGQVLTFSKDVDLMESYNLDFSDLKMSEKTMIKSVAVTFKDKVSGEIYETKKIEMTQAKVYSQSNKLEDILTWSGIILGMIALILLAIYVKNKRKINLVLGVIFLIFSIVVLVLVSLFDVTKVFADKEQTISTVWFDQAPSGNQGICPQTLTVVVSGSATCGTCRNGVLYSGRIGFRGDYIDIQVGDLGHIYETTIFGPYTVSAPLATSHDWYEAIMNTTEGSHCLASTAVVTGPTVWCTAPVPLTGTCSASPTNPTVGQEVTWTAIGDGGTGLHTYSFTGTDGLSHSGTNIAKKTYTMPGPKTTTVTIGERGGNQTINVQCGSVNVGSANTLYCGSLLNQTSPTLPVNNGTNLCGTGKFVINSPFSDGNGKWWWSCGLTPTATNKMWCPAYGAPIISTCGTASGTPMLSEPNINTPGLCSGGSSTVGNIATYYNVIADPNDDHYQWSCTGSQGAATWVCKAPRINDNPPPGSDIGAPVTTLTASPTSVSTAGSSTLTWSVAESGQTTRSAAFNASTTCTASQGWSGSKSLAGGTSVQTNLTLPSYTYTLTCGNPVGTSTATATVTVSDNPPGGCSGCVHHDPIIPGAAANILGIQADCGGYIYLNWSNPLVPIGTSYIIYESGGLPVPTANIQLVTGRSAVIQSTPLSPHQYKVQVLNGNQPLPGFYSTPSPINSSPECDLPPLPSVACSVKLQPNASSTVVLNSQTTWIVSDNNNTLPGFGGMKKNWLFSKQDGTVERSVPATTTNSINHTFTTIGVKKVSVQVATSSSLLIYQDCNDSATTTVIQEDDAIIER